MKDIDNRWMPPSPHREEVIKFLERGRAHIEERGHNVPPLLVFEDGGVMELPLARYKDGNFSPAKGENSSRQTSYYDICGTIDEFKELLAEKPEMAKSDPERLFKLIDDVIYMLSRQQRRQGKYREFAEAVNSVSERLNQITGPDVEGAQQRSEILKDWIRSEPDKVAENLQGLYDMVELVRDVANRMEKEVLYSYRDLAIELGEIYSQIRGSRKWDKE